MAEPADINVDELRRRARRRLVGAIVLALGVAVVVPMLLETEQKPLGEDVSVKIPPVDDGKFVNRLNEKAATPQKADEAAATRPSSSEPATASSAANSSPEAASSATTAPSPEPAPARTSKYDTRVPEAQEAPAKADAAGAAANAPATAANAPATASSTAANAPAPAKATQSPATSASVAKSAEPATASPAASGPAASASGSKPAATSTAETHAAAHASSSTSHHEGFAVQLAAFADDKGANSLANRLKRAGYAAYTEPLKTSKGTLWRVRVGPYPSREAALAARDKLKTEGQSGIVAAAR